MTNILEELSNEDLMILEKALNKAILYMQGSIFQTIDTAVSNAKEIVEYDRLRNLIKDYRTSREEDDGHL